MTGGMTNAQKTVDISGKQDKLTAGSNITINGNTISATDTKYSAGTGISISGTTISATSGGGSKFISIPQVVYITYVAQFKANSSTSAFGYKCSNYGSGIENAGSKTQTSLSVTNGTVYSRAITEVSSSETDLDGTTVYYMQNRNDDWGTEILKLFTINGLFTGTLTVRTIPLYMYVVQGTSTTSTSTFYTDNSSKTGITFTFTNSQCTKMANTGTNPISGIAVPAGSTVKIMLALGDASATGSFN